MHSRTAIVVDDGIVTGARALAALRSVVEAGASRAVLVSLEEDQHFVSIADYFDDFPPVSSLEVRRCLEAAAHQLPVC